MLNLVHHYCVFLLIFSSFFWLTVFLSKITTSKLKSLRKSFVEPTVHANVTSTKTICFEWRAWSWWYWPMQVWALHKKWSFPLRISAVNVTKSAGNCAFGHIYRINPWCKISFFVQWRFPRTSVFHPPELKSYLSFPYTHDTAIVWNNAMNNNPIDNE